MKVPKLKSHASCLNLKYLNGPQRGNVPIDKVPFTIPYPEYCPVTFTAISVLNRPVWADNESTKGIQFNIQDVNTNRVSYYGPYKVVEGLPMNPIGRTGICGRGLLGKWGPNHAADPIVTRWKRNANKEIVKDKTTGKSILEFVGIKRRDTGEWALPGGMVEAGDTVSLTLKKEFGEEALNSIEMDKSSRENLKKNLDELFTHGVELYKGYVDDPRNTDNAWMETVAVNFHDSGNNFDTFKLNAGDDAGAVSWIIIDKNIKLYANHKQLIEAVAKINSAHW